MLPRKLMPLRHRRLSAHHQLMSAPRTPEDDRKEKMVEKRAEKRKAAVEYIKTKDYYENASLVAKMFVPDRELPLSKRAWERLLCEWRHLLQRDVIGSGPV